MDDVEPLHCLVDAQPLQAPSTQRNGRTGRRQQACGHVSQHRRLLQRAAVRDTSIVRTSGRQPHTQRTCRYVGMFSCASFQLLPSALRLPLIMLLS
jgi:hypothetical protein